MPSDFRLRLRTDGTLEGTRAMGEGDHELSLGQVLFWLERVAARARALGGGELWIEVRYPDEGAREADTAVKSFVQACWQIVDNYGGRRPTAALLSRWKAELFDGDEAAMLSRLKDLGPSGALGKGTGYLLACLRGDKQKLGMDAQRKAKLKTLFDEVHTDASST